MRRFTDTPFEAQLEVVATLAGRAIQASLAELRREDELTLAMRSSLRDGVRVEDLSDATGLTVAEIQRRASAELKILNDLPDLAGLS